MSATKTRYAPHVRNAAIGTLVAGALAAGVVFLGPEKSAGPPPAAGPAGRAMLAADAGAPASLPELSKLIRDREKWLKESPDDGRSWALLGSAYVARGTLLGDWESFPKAETALKNSLAVRPGAKANPEAQLGMAALANARRDYPAAKRWAEAVRAQAPKRWATYAVLSETYGGLGDYRAAAQATEQLLKLRPDTARALGRAAEAYSDRGWREDALEKADEALARATNPAEKAAAQHRLGELAWERGEPAEAVGHYDAALRIDAGHHAALAGRGRALAALGRTEEALRDYATAVEKRPLPQYALEAGELFESLDLDGDAQGQYDLMRERATRAREHGGSEELVLARYETDHGQAKSAVVRLTGEWERGHRSVYMADALGWALFRAGKEEEALPYAKRATALGMRNALFAYHRGAIERWLGLYGPARRHIGEALRINPDFSPLLAPAARKALKALGEPPSGGPRDVTGDPSIPIPTPSLSPSGSGAGSPSPSPSASAADPSPS
ncbi:tetratricopeptide repeat protein [Streptomyces sp. NPDC000410]|uniref:tetratricopeptide repeat protein n=1 Tax=Streptomyces sp. NPDC000410 TaxID=3154254 RepID=UPI00332BB070